MNGRTLAHQLLPWTPAVVLLGVALANVLLGAAHSVASLVVIAPLLAANLVRPALTGAWALASLATWWLLSAVGDQFASAAAREASIIRGLGIGIGCIIAVAASSTRVVRERRLRQMQQVAMVAQQAILAPVPPRLPHVELAARYASSAQGATVGGDFYHAASTQFGTRLLIGDVRGKGLEAVRLAATVLGAFRERVDEHADLGDLLGKMSEAVQRQAAPGDFATALVVQIDAGAMMMIASAGHPGPIIVHDDAPTLIAFPRPRPPLGVDGQGVSVRVPFRVGDQIVLYTDGATEARRHSDRALFDEARLVAAANQSHEPARMVDTILRELQYWTGSKLSDDVALLAATRVPVASPTVTSDMRAPVSDLITRRA